MEVDSLFGREKIMQDIMKYMQLHMELSILHAAMLRGVSVRPILYLITIYYEPFQYQSQFMLSFVGSS